MGYSFFESGFISMAAMLFRSGRSATGAIIFFSLLIGGAIIAFFLLMGRFKSGTRPLWAQLVPVINGRLKMSNWTYSGTKLNGTYNGLPVVAWVDYDKYVEAVGKVVSHDYFFAVEGTTGARGGNWKLRYSAFNPGWGIEADGALQQRLYQAGILSVTQSLPPQSSAAYNARHGTLRVRVPIKNERAVPTPDVFKHELDTLLYLANINGQVNI